MGPQGVGRQWGVPVRMALGLERCAFMFLLHHKLAMQFGAN